MDVPLSTVRVLPAPTLKTWLAALGLGSLALFSFPGFHQWDSELWGGFIGSSMLALWALASLVDAVHAAPYYREYGLALPPENKLGDCVRVRFHLRGGPQGCRVGTLHWTLECTEVTHVETDYIEGVVYKPTYLTVHQSQGDLDVDAHLFPGEEQLWVLPVPLPADGPPSFASGRDDTVGAITWRLTVQMRVPGQAPLGVGAELSCSGP